MYTSVPLLALLSSLAACLQIMGGFWPGIGHIISVFATAPVMIAANINFISGIKVYFVTSLIVFLIQPMETPIFVFTTGLLGLVLGYGSGCSWKKWKIVLSSGLILGSSILVCIYLTGIPLLGGIGRNTGIYRRIIAIYIFSFVYCFLWLYLDNFLKKFLPWFC